MKIGALLLGISGTLFWAALAGAQSAPRAQVGFQMDIRTGYSIPMGKLAGGASMSDFTSGHVPFIVDIGGKVIPNLFVGGYFGLGFGSAAGLTKQYCDANGQNCAVVAVHVGIEAQYHILPSALANPWLGYGLGVESLALGQNHGDTTGYSGFEFARLMAGVDFRVNRIFGVGPFVDLSLTKFNTASLNSSSENIQNTATHEWLTLGVRFVFFP